MDKPLVIAHGNCADGYTALWLANLWYWGTRNPGEPHELVVDYHPGIYGEPPPDVTGRKVYILDFSYPPEVIDMMAQQAEWIVMIDHHETAVRKFDEYVCPQNVQMILDTTRSGAYLTSKFFWPNSEPFTMVKLVDDRDRWVFKDERSRPFHATLFSHPFKIGAWNRLHHNIEASVREGEGIERKHMKDIDELIPQLAHFCRYMGHKVVVANAPYMLASDMGHKMLDKYPDAEFAAVYYIKHDQTLVFSLRSRKDELNVAKIAEAFGGGGHPSAAGMKVKSFPFDPDVELKAA